MQKRCQFCHSLMCLKLSGGAGCGGRFPPLTEYQQGFEAGEDLWRRTFTELRQQLRQIIYEKGIASNPAVDDQWIVDELRKLLGIKDSPHRFLNFSR